MVTPTLPPFVLPVIELRFTTRATTSAYRRYLSALCIDTLAIVVLERNKPVSPPLVKENTYKKTQKPCNTAKGRKAGCATSVRLSKMARACVRFISREHNEPRVNPLPSLVTCGSLRSTVRQAFGKDLSPLVELSVKTSQKLERTFCDHCADRLSGQVRDWKKKRLEAVDAADSSHIERFKLAFRCNVDHGWNKREFPYIPTGNATIVHSRCEGGSWCVEPLRFDCKPLPIISSGKPRIVTLFSSRYTEVLSPLHRSLFSTLKRKGWLLVGPPTDSRVRWLNGDHEYVSIDYSSATDNIRVDYVNAAVDVLLSQADPPLTGEEQACMRALANLTFEGGGRATTGQPMGSVMSFPVLCLFNKTVVDLALLDLLEGGEISPKEWVSHRCLINGDDLLYREPCPGLKLYNRIVSHGGRVGLVVNVEKTMSDPKLGEINSTLFKDARLEKKVNCAALFPARDVTDVIGLARDSSRTLAGFKHLVLRALGPLSRQETKVQRHLPSPFWRVIWRDPRITAAVLSRPVFGKDNRQNLFPVTPRPVGYHLTRREEKDAIASRVEFIRKSGMKQPRGVRRPVIASEEQKRAYVLRSKTPPEDTILSVLAAAWWKKEWDGLSERPGLPTHDVRSWIMFDGERELSVLDKLVNMIRVGRGALRKPTEGSRQDIRDVMRSFGILDDGYIPLV